MGAPKNNKNAANFRYVKAAMMKALRKASGEPVIDGGKDEFVALVTICEKVIEKAMEGDMVAFKEMADRLEGKPSQQMNIDAEVVNKSAREMTDDELATIASRSS